MWLYVNMIMENYTLQMEWQNDTSTSWEGRSHKLTCDTVA